MSAVSTGASASTCGRGGLCLKDKHCSDYRCPGRGMAPARQHAATPPTGRLTPLPCKAVHTSNPRPRGVWELLQAKRHTIATAVSGIVLLGSVVALLAVDGSIDDHSAERDQAANLERDQRAELAEERLARAAAAGCGNAGWVRVDQTSYQCVARVGGRKAVTARVSP